MQPLTASLPPRLLLPPQVDTKGEHNPIKQDEKKGKARLYHGPIFWNYGCLPQTCALALSPISPPPTYTCPSASFMHDQIAVSTR